MSNSGGIFGYIGCRLPSDGGYVAASEDICVGGIEVRPRERVVLVNGREVLLSTREFEIVMMLAEHAGWVFSANQLAGDPGVGDYSPESVSVLVSRLRHKLAEAGALDVVETVRGVGYRLRSSRESEGVPPATGSVNRELRDAGWRLQEAVFEAERCATSEQLDKVADVLEQARRAIYASLAE